MRRKGEREIPDFSPKHKAPQGVVPDPKVSKAPHPARVPAIKPHATAAKSGRRGQ